MASQIAEAQVEKVTTAVAEFTEWLDSSEAAQAELAATGRTGGLTEAEKILLRTLEILFARGEKIPDCVLKRNPPFFKHRTWNLAWDVGAKHNRPGLDGALKPTAVLISEANSEIQFSSNPLGLDFGPMSL